MTIIKLDLANAKYRDRPWEVFRELREMGPVVRVKLPFMGKTWAATTYESVSDVLKNTEAFVRDPANAGRKNFIPMQWILPRSLLSLAHNMLGADGQKHRRLRFVVDKAFALRNIDAMSEQIEAIALEQLNQVDAVLNRDGKVDLIKDYARPVPLTAICELLGLPLADRPKFSKWFEPFSTISSIFGILKLGGSLRNVIRYLRQQFEVVKKDPRPGLMSALVQADYEGERLSDDELLSMVFLLLAAGHETTVHLISNMLLTLMQHPQSMQALMDDWSKSENAIEEVLRYASPIQMTKPRYVVNDMEYYGQPLRRGELITSMIACANYDPARFENPDVFNINRERIYHMTFGSGPHVCLGMKLARTETYHAVKCLLERYPNLKPEFDLQNPDWSKRIGMRGMNSFVVRSE